MKIQTFLREKVGKASNHKLKTEGKLPAVFYGKTGNTNLALYQAAIQSFFLETQGKMQIIELGIEKSESKKAIIQDYQYSRVKNQFIHVDFLEVTDNTILHLDIPIRTTGVSIVSKMGGIEQVIRREIPVTCQAKDIPEYIEIDISKLDFGNSIHVLDISYPSGVKPIVTGRNFTIISTSGVSETVIEEPETEVEAEVEVEAEKEAEK